MPTIARGDDAAWTCYNDLLAGLSPHFACLPLLRVHKVPMMRRLSEIVDNIYAADMTPVPAGKKHLEPDMNTMRSKRRSWEASSTSCWD